MRRSASEVIRNLEGRISRLENSTSRTKSAAQTANLSNDRAIVMVDDSQLKDGIINLCFMHMNNSILKKSVGNFVRAIWVTNTPWGIDIVEDYDFKYRGECCAYFTVKLSSSNIIEPEGVDASDIARDWVNYNIINTPNSIPAKL
jgi:hypothetical protein